MANEIIGGEPARVAEIKIAADRKFGVIAALSSYFIWGLFPLLFQQLETVEPLTVVAHRIVWSALFVGVILFFRGRMKEVRAALSHWKSIRGIFLSAVLLAINWLVFIWSVSNGLVLEASFGYFITPLVNVALGMVILGERLNRLQTLSVVIALIAVGILATGLGGLPLVSLALAGSFGLYGYFRKTVNVGSAPGLFVETLMLLPFALAYLAYGFYTNGAGVLADTHLVIFLLLTGPATSITLILFAYGAKRLEMSMIGMLQYIAPIGHLLLAIFWFREELGHAQVLSFSVIWISLAIYSYDNLRRRPKRTKKNHG